MALSKPCTICNDNSRPVSKGICNRCRARQRASLGCSVEGCEGKGFSRGFCNKHYQEAKANGTITVVPKGTIKVCQSEGCTSTKIEGHGLCSLHYKQMRRANKPKVVKPHKNSQPSKERTKQCPDCYLWWKPSYFKSLVCGTCARRAWAARNPEKLKEYSQKRSEATAANHVHIPEDKEISTVGSLVKIEVNAKTLADRAKLQITNLEKYLKSLQKDTIIESYTYDVKTMLVTIFISKEYEFMFNAGLNQKPVGIEEW